MKSEKIPLPAFRPYLSSIQSSSLKMLPYWLAAAVTALVSVAFARVFHWSEELSFSWSAVHPAWAFALTPLAMLASSNLAQAFSPAASGSGIPQLLAAVEISREPSPLLDRLLSLKMIVVKFLGSCICVAGGGVTGREGPMLQISAGIFRQIQRIWPKAKVKPDLQSMILAGGAAGLASAFNTPLGGVIFAIEELAKVHISHIRTYVFHAVIIAGIMAQAILGNYLYLGKIRPAPASASEMIPMIIAMAFIGLLGAIFGRATVAALDWRARRSTLIKTGMTLACGLVVATIFYFSGKDAIGSGRTVIVDLLAQPNETAYASMGFIRAFTNFFTYAGGVVGGIFAPALSTGAALGSWLSGAMPGYDHQVWALMGMVAFLTGVTRTPFTSMILVLEMTDTHNVIINLMLAGVVAQSAAKFVDPTSFYEHMSHRLIHGGPLAKEGQDEQAKCG